MVASLLDAVLVGLARLVASGVVLPLLSPQPKHGDISQSKTYITWTGHTYLSHGCFWSAKSVMKRAVGRGVCGSASHTASIRVVGISGFRCFGASGFIGFGVWEFGVRQPFHCRVSLCRLIRFIATVAWFYDKREVFKGDLLIRIYLDLLFNLYFY